MKMARATYVPVTGSVLRWARLEAGLTELGLASKIQATVPDVKAWEASAAHPTKTQFKKIVAVLRRPSALFFAPSPPHTQPLRASFRRNADADAGAASSDEVLQARTARRYQMIAEWLNEELSADSMPEIPSLSGPSERRPASAAADLRAKLEVPFNVQRSWDTFATALKEWRAQVEQLGILVFQMQFPAAAKATRGFSLPSETAPVVVLNSAFLEQARIYTLFHEVAHLILGDAVVCDKWVDEETRSAQERWAESFAADLLLPTGDFRRVVREVVGSASITPSDVMRLARRTKVSVRAAALRCVELGYEDWTLYHDVVRQLRNIDYRPPSDGGGGEATPYRRLREIGPRLPAMLFEARDRNVISHYDLLRHLDMNTAQAQELQGAVAYN
jgi:Zn-dependent peptidase ImmA (M78 family)